MDKAIIDYLILAFTFGSAFVIVGYEDEARERGWPVGSWLSGDAPPLKIIAILNMLLAIGLSFYIYKWWSPLVVLAVGFIYGFLASMILRYRVQFLALVGTVVGFVLCLVYVL